MLTPYESFNLIEIQFYYFQQSIYQLIAYQLNHFTASIFILLFIGGIFTSLNPCLISVIPLSISYIIESELNNTKKIIFILGIASSILSIIIVTFLLHDYYQQIIKNVPILSSILMIIIGLSLLQIVSIQLTYLTRDPFQELYNENEYMLQDYITGFIIGLSSSTCSTPILMTILFWISYSNNILLGIIYICFYLIGYIAPLLLLVNLTITSIKINIINKIWNYIIPFSGSIMLGLGIFSLLNKIFI